jgi:hypothetical protein
MKHEYLEFDERCMREDIYCLAIQTLCLCTFLQQGKGLTTNQAQIGSPLDANNKAQPLVVIVVNFVCNQGCCHHSHAIMTTMAIARIIITMTTIIDQTQMSIGFGFHCQQGGREGGASSSLLSSLVAHTKNKGVIIIVISTIVASKRNGGEWVELKHHC